MPRYLQSSPSLFVTVELSSSSSSSFFFPCVTATAPCLPGPAGGPRHLGSTGPCGLKILHLAAARPVCSNQGKRQGIRKLCAKGNSKGLCEIMGEADESYVVSVPRPSRLSASGRNKSIHPSILFVALRATS
ncbi:hypothetical protein N658DRAFT_47694 [Parathielavia hyrcaniae]|uniref:Uncharacterized protein n=1 Tax=Parathielavia hyrcaniae TaxID=113614 RepID=A0AAN6PT38_9PEZI|nr:hypothetical protein N658DRAFT_47694 [Parathielavia hyrcaniae]